MLNIVGLSLGRNGVKMAVDELHSLELFLRIKVEICNLFRLISYTLIR